MGWATVVLFRQKQEFLFLATTKRTALGPICVPIQYVLEGLYSEIKCLEPEMPRSGVRGALPPFPVDFHGVKHSQRSKFRKLEHICPLLYSPI